MAWDGPQSPLALSSPHRREASLGVCRVQVLLPSRDLPSGPSPSCLPDPQVCTPTLEAGAGASTLLPVCGVPEGGVSAASLLPLPRIQPGRPAPTPRPAAAPHPDCLAVPQSRRAPGRPHPAQVSAGAGPPHRPSSDGCGGGEAQIVPHLVQCVWVQRWGSRVRPRPGLLLPPGVHAGCCTSWPAEDLFWGSQEGSRPRLSRAWLSPASLPLSRPVSLPLAPQRRPRPGRGGAPCPRRVAPQPAGQHQVRAPVAHPRGPRRLPQVVPLPPAPGAAPR